MRRLRALLGLALFAALGAAPLACGNDVYIQSSKGGEPGQPSGACCTEFKVGADLTDVDFGVAPAIKGTFGVLAQAASDISTTTTAMVVAVTSSCRNIAQDLGAAPALQAAAEAEPVASKRVKLWCQLAVARLDAAGVRAGTLDIELPKYKCETSVATKLACQDRCDPSGACDPKAIPLTCIGGTLEHACGGICAPRSTGESFDCKGSCTDAVSGTCTDQGGVDCNGRCEGICGGPYDAKGNCLGMCKGTCLTTAAGATCNGLFDGICRGECKPSGTTPSVQCSGQCAVEAKPMKCRNGKLDGGCRVDARCDGNCDASLEARAACTIQPFRIVARDPSVDLVLGFIPALLTLRKNLPQVLLMVRARGESIARVFTYFRYFPDITDVVAEPGELGMKGTACAITIVSTVGEASENAAASIEAGLGVAAQIGL